MKPSDAGTRRPAPTLGILGGGQLARMTAQAAYKFGCEVVVLERGRHNPAASVATRTVLGHWEDTEALVRLASQVDVVTLENEFVDAGCLATLEDKGFRLLPVSATIRTVQDKLTQKEAFEAAGLPVPAFTAAPEPSSIRAAAQSLGWPLLLKKRRLGYDGKGNATVSGESEAEEAWKRLGGGEADLYVEQFFPFAAELAVILTRDLRGNVVTYPVVETIQRDHICHIVKAPAALPPEVALRAEQIARQAVESVDGIGSFGVELFLAGDGTIAINEMAPRVHNSGHYTIEACECSQFENHVRAVLGLPLGSSAMRAPAAVMVNLLADGPGPGRPRGLDEALRVPGAHVHVYGKSRATRGRKMGHVTALGDTLDEAMATASEAAGCIRFGGGG